MNDLRALKNFILFLGLSATAVANGIYRDGAGARAMALGGASVGLDGQGLEALHSNPAGLSATNGITLQLGGVGAMAQGNFSNGANANSKLHEAFGAVPEVAIVYPLESVPVTLGLAVIPEALSSVDWQFVDAPGGLGGTTSYGLQQHHAEIIAYRAAVGANWKISDSLSLGAAIGAEYNRNTLVAPYTFQNHPALTGFKTLLDLQTEGWGVNGDIGIVWRPCEKIIIGLSYRTQTELETDGDANGNAGTQLQNIGAGSFQPDFHYDATVSTKLPQAVTAGISWQAQPRLRAVFQVEWINWSDSFDELDIQLAHGSNPDINGFLGSDQIHDVVPLNWKDRFVYRTGLEFAAAEEIILRAGYAYGANPVPDSTLTPMSAAILEHAITGGVEWRRGRWTVAAAYQYDFSATSNVGASGLASGEYSNSRTRVEAHWFGLTTSIRF